MSLWIHCNLCCVRYRPHVNFFVTNCGHIVCEQCCSRRKNKNLCLKCNAICKYEAIKKNCRREVEQLFRPISNSFERTQRINAFQFDNMLEMLKYRTCKYETYMNEYINLWEKVIEIQQNTTELEAAIRKKQNAAPINTLGNEGFMFRYVAPSYGSSSSYNVLKQKILQSHHNLAQKSYVKIQSAIPRHQRALSNFKNNTTIQDISSNPPLSLRAFRRRNVSQPTPAAHSSSTASFQFPDITLRLRLDSTTKSNN